MKEFLKKVWTRAAVLVERYPVIVAALVIYLWYLLTSFNLFQHKTEHHSFSITSWNSIRCSFYGSRRRHYCRYKIPQVAT